MTWLQGGPFLEVSILSNFYSDRKVFVENILIKLQVILPTLEFVVPNSELKNKIMEFVNGYSDNEGEPDPRTYHSVQIPIFVDIDERRKSILSFDQISEELMEIGFWFYGSEYDAPEWSQRGITKEQLPSFKQFLSTLVDNLDYVFATLGYEISVTDLFDTNESWPHQTYNLNNLKKQLFVGEKMDYFECIIADTRYSYLINMREFKPMGQKLILQDHKYCP